MSQSGNIKFTKLVLEKQDFNKLSPKYKKRYIMLTFILRDLNLLQKCLVYSGNNEHSENPLLAATTTTWIFFLKTLISKCYEIWTFLTKNKVLADISTLSSELTTITNDIQNFFSDKKVEEIFSFIRNKFGFHYEYFDDVDSLIDDGIQLIDQLEMWLSEDSGNEVFEFSDKLILNVIVAKMKALGFQGDNINKIHELALTAARLSRDFCVLYIAEAFPVRRRLEQKIEIDVPSILEVHLPFIVKEK